MFACSATCGRPIKPGMKKDFYRVVENRLIPAWSQTLHALAFSADCPEMAEPSFQGAFPARDIDCLSRNATDEALGAPRGGGGGAGLYAGDAGWATLPCNLLRAA